MGADHRVELNHIGTEKHRKYIGNGFNILKPNNIIT